MNAQQLEERMTSGQPVAVVNQRYGTPIFRILHRTPQLCTLQATGNLMGSAPWLMKLSNIQRMTPGDVARRFLPPGAVMTVKPYDILPIPDGDYGFTPNEIMTAIVKIHQPATTHVVQQAVLVYEHAQAWFRQHILPTSVGCLAWLNRADAKQFKAKQCDLKSVQGWTAYNGMPNIPKHHLYRLPNSKRIQAHLGSPAYRETMMEYAKACGAINAKA